MPDEAEAWKVTVLFGGTLWYGVVATHDPAMVAE